MTNIHHRSAVVEALILERLNRTPYPGVPTRQMWRALSNSGMSPAEFGETVRQLTSDSTFIITVQYPVAGRKSMAETPIDLSRVPTPFDFTDFRYIDTLGQQTYTPLVYLSADPLPEKVKRLLTMIGAS